MPEIMRPREADRAILSGTPIGVSTWRSARVLLPTIVGLVLLLVGCSASIERPEVPGTSVAGDLAQAVAAGDAVTARRLLADGADPDAPVVLGMTPLMRAVNRGDAEIAALLVEFGADLMTAPAGLTAVHVAAGAGAVEALEVLLEAGADPAVRSVDGMNALDHAAHSGAVDVLERLVDSGIDIDEQSQVVTQGHGYPRDLGPTPLSLAVRAGRIEAVVALLALGADVDGRSQAGHPPVLVAVFSDQSPETVEVLLDAGADTMVAARCDRGCSVGDGRPLTAREWAEELGRVELEDLLDGP